MDEEDGRPGALAAQPGPFDAPGGVSAPSLCHPWSHSSASDPGCPISDALFAADVGNHERIALDPGCPISDALFAADVGNHESRPSRAAALNEEKQHLHFRVFRSTTTFRAPSVRLLSGQGVGKHPCNTRPSTALNTQTWEGRRQLAPPQVEENHENVPGK